MGNQQLAETTRTDCFCTFRLAGRRFGFDIGTVREVNTQTAFTPVPHAPPAVRGYVNLRGHLFLVLDLRLLLGLEPAPVTPDSRLVIFKPSVGESFGVLVAQIAAILTLPADQTEEPLPGSETKEGQGGELVAGIGKLEGELLVIVNPHPLLPMVAGALQASRSPRGE